MKSSSMPFLRVWLAAALVAAAGRAASGARAAERRASHQVAAPSPSGPAGAAASAAGEVAPRWGAMVINLARRPERLSRFLGALRSEQPWLLEPGRLCRVEGRDGRELPQLAAAPPDRAAGVAEKKADPDRPVAGSLSDAAALVRDGWVTAAALATAESPDPGLWPNMTAGGLGLYLGHAAAWRHIVHSGLDYGLVFEDDLTLFAPSFRDNVSAALAGGEPLPALAAAGAAGAPARWDLLYLQRCNDDAWPKERVWVKATGPNSRASAVVPVAANESVTCTGAYVLSNAGARKLLAGALPARLQLDGQLEHVPGLVRAALSPPVAQCQEVFKNKIGGRYRDTDVQNKGDNIGELASNMQALMNAAANKWLKGHPESVRSARGGVRGARAGHRSIVGLLERGAVAGDIPGCGGA